MQHSDNSSLKLFSEIPKKVSIGDKIVKGLPLHSTDVIFEHIVTTSFPLRFPTCVADQHIAASQHVEAMHIPSVQRPNATQLYDISHRECEAVLVR